MVAMDGSGLGESRCAMVQLWEVREARSAQSNSAHAFAERPTPQSCPGDYCPPSC